MNVPARRSRFRAAWREAFADRRFRAVFIASLLFALLSLAALARYLPVAEERPGVVLPDPLLATFEPMDLSPLTFGLMYGAVLLGLVVLLPRPRRLAVALRAYGFVCLMRFLGMYLTPLDPPVTTVPLVDPFVSTAVGAAAAPTKDLFFSGHTSLAFLLFLACPGRWVRGVFAAVTVGIAAAVVLQHVHYAVDVGVAPLAAYASWHLSRLLERRRSWD